MQHITRKSPFLALAAILVALAVIVPLGPLGKGRAVAAGGKTITMSGQVANAFASSFHNWGDNGPPPGAINVNVGVFQSGSATSRQTILSYDVYTFQWDPVNQFWNYVSLESGWGTIPNSAVQVSGGAKPTSVTLSIDTSTLNPATFQRFAGSGGLISVTWKAISGFSSSNSGSSQGTFGFNGQTMSWSNSGGSYNTSASGLGTVIGYALPDPTADSNYASMGSVQGVSACRGCTF
jgi:hypothetical protein